MLLGWSLSLVAAANGVLFGGLDVAAFTLISAFCCAVVTPITVTILERRGSSPTRRAGMLVAVGLSLATIGLGSFFSTRKHLEILLNPMQVPADFRVQRGHRFLHSIHVHFIGSPATISALIRAKQLVEVPAAVPDDEPDISRSSARRQSAEEWDWWRPASMPGAKFYYLHHKSQAIQGWAEGWWVNGATNEVYAFIGG